jgi:hypothetical protein
MYALSACAAGVGVLALAQPAEARIVYTKAHQRIPINTDYPLDLNHDGITDLSIYDRSTTTGSGVRYDALWAQLRYRNSLDGSRLRTQNNGGLPAALKRGLLVGPPWYSARTELMAIASSRGRKRGNWLSVDNRYLGIKFQIKGKYHYGWVRMRVEVIGPNIIATLNGYAFETIAGKSIKAGQTKEADDQVSGPGPSLTNPIPTTQPASLGALAVGSDLAAEGTRARLACFSPPAQNG